MSQWSIPIQPTPPGWKLRVLSGRMLGTEFDLPNRRYILGSQPPSDIVIAHPDIAPQHVTIELRHDGAHLTDISQRRGMLVNGRRVRGAQVAPGDHVEVGPLKFEFSNPDYKPPAKSGSGDSFWTWLEKRPLWQRVGGILLVVAVVLFMLLACTGTPTLVPVTLVMMSAVVPISVICWMVEKYDINRYSFYTLTITFLAGGTVGVIAAMLGFLVTDAATCGLTTSLAVFAGFIEEPAKLLGTAWRWRHPGYDRPMDGLILGAVSGFGFAVMETAGYGFTHLFGGPEVSPDEESYRLVGQFFTSIANQMTGADVSMASFLTTVVMRSVMSPFAHGLWSGILGAAFWASGRNWGRAVRSKEFWMSAALAVGLHGLWNFDLFDFWLLPCIASGTLSVFVVRQLWIKKGYFSLDPSFWRR